MSSEQIQNIPLDKLFVNPQVRTIFDPEAIAGLAETLKSTGRLLQPIRVRQVGGKYLIVVGERRFRAAKLLNWPTIPAIVESKELSEGETLLQQLVENGQQVNLKPVELATAIARQIDVAGWKLGQAAQQLGKSPAAISKLLGLLKLPTAIQEQVSAGVIPASAAYELSRLSDPVAQQALAAELAAGRLTRDGLAGAIKQRVRQATEPAEKPVHRVTAQLGQGRSVTVVGASLSLETLIETLEELLTRAKRMRPRGIQLKTFAQLLKEELQA